MIITAGILLALTLGVVFLILALVFLITSFTIVRPNERGVLYSMGQYSKTLEPNWYITLPWQSIHKNEWNPSTKQGDWTYVTQNHHVVLFDYNSKRPDGYQQIVRPDNQRNHALKVLNDGYHALQPGQELVRFETGVIEKDITLDNIMLNGGISVRGTLFLSYRITNPQNAAISFSHGQSALDKAVIGRVRSALCSELRTHHRESPPAAYQQEQGEEAAGDQANGSLLFGREVSEALDHTKTALNREIGTQWGIELTRVALESVEYANPSAAKAMEELVLVRAQTQAQVMQAKAKAEIKVIEGQALKEKAAKAGVTPLQMLTAESLKSANMIVTSSPLPANLLLPGVATSPLAGTASNQSGNGLGLTPANATH